MNQKGEDFKSNHLEEGVPESVKLNKRQLNLFDFLRTHSGQKSEPLSMKDISSKFKLSKGSVSNLLSSLRKKGIPIESWKEGRESRYSLSPDALGISVSPNSSHRKSDYTYSALYLGDPAWGTKISDQQALKGLRLALETNGLNKEIERVFISGDTVPHVPPYDTVSYRSDAKLLGKTRREEGDISATRFTENKISNKWERKFYEEQVSNDEFRKITDLSDAFKEVGENLSYLMGSFDKNTELIIQSGEADKKNKRHIEDALVKDWAGEKEERAKEVRDYVFDEAMPLVEREIKERTQRNFLEKFLSDSSLRKKKGESRELFIQRVYEHVDDFGYNEVVNQARKNWAQVRDNDSGWEEIIGSTKFDFEETFESVLNIVYNAGQKDEKIIKKIERIDSDLGTVSGKKETLLSKLDDAERSIGWAQSLLGGSRQAITWFTKQYPITADDSELAHKKAKDLYYQHFHDIDIKQRATVHDSERKSKEVGVIPNVNNPEEKLVDAEIEYENVPGRNKKITLVHNMRHTFSNSVAGTSIKDAKIAANIENMVLKKLYNERPSDIMILGSHSAGGFRAQPWFMESEHIEYNSEAEDSNKGFVEGQKVGWLINLPKFQSLEKLVWARDKGFKNWHVKAMEKGPFATGAVIHTEEKDGVNNFLYMDNSVLQEFGNISDEIETYKRELKEDNLSKEDRMKLTREIKSKKEEIKFRWKTIEVGGDFHLGTIDMQEGYSKDQLIKASQIYHRRNGLPDYVVYDEVLHGCEERMFKNAARHEATDPEEFLQRVINKIESNSNLSDKEKFDALRRATMKHNRKIPVHNTSVQKKLFRRLIKEPYLDRIIENGGEVMFTSGNHYNKAHPTSDEAVELANQFPLSYVDEGIVKTFSGKGNPHGLGTTNLQNDSSSKNTLIEGGTKLFSMHKYKEQKDEIFGAMSQLRKSNNDADIALAGDRHQAGFGYADGHAVVLHPGMEPMNGYVPLVSKPAGIRGEIDLKFDPRYQGKICVFKNILNPTLEKIIHEEDII